MKKILILCPYPQNVAAGQRFKYEQYFNSWINQGYSLEVSSFFNEKTWTILYKDGNFIGKAIGTIKGYISRIKFLFLLKRYHIVYIFMWVTPLGTTLFERLVRRFSKNLIYDFDDSVFLDSNTPESMNLGLSGVTRKSRYLISYADRVILSSPYNLEFCLEKNLKKQAVYIPCSIDTDRFKEKKQVNEDQKVVIGWTGTFSSIPYLDSLKEALLRLSQEVPYKLLLITNFDYSFKEVDLEVSQWNRDTEIEDLHSIDIGIYPVTLDQWALGKGGLKVIQYMSIGVPSVATNYGTACDIIEDGVNGFLVNNDDEWIDRLKELISDVNLRKNMGLAARKKAESLYSTKVVESKYLKVLNSIE
tara:strand:- start:199 stop:1278 length:1080 start_codon:yes stop_codon:yes gene_type:complete